MTATTHEEMVKAGTLQPVGYLCPKCGFIQERLEHVNETPPAPMCPPCGKEIPEGQPHVQMQKVKITKTVTVEPTA